MRAIRFEHAGKVYSAILYKDGSPCVVDVVYKVERNVFHGRAPRERMVSRTIWSDGRTAKPSRLVADILELIANNPLTADRVSR
jgi:hypothetical protein